jgi:hypothetical protein
MSRTMPSGADAAWDPGAQVARMVFLTARRHVDYGRVRSAICPAH